MSPYTRKKTKTSTNKHALVPEKQTQLYETLFDRLDTLSRVSLPSGSPSHQQAGRDFDLLLDHLSDSICAARELCRQFFTAALTGETPTLSEEPLLLETTSSEELVDGSVLW